MSFKAGDKVCVFHGSCNLGIIDGEVAHYTGLQLQGRIFVVIAIQNRNNIVIQDTYNKELILFAQSEFCTLLIDFVSNPSKVQEIEVHPETTELVIKFSR